MILSNVSMEEAMKVLSSSQKVAITVVDENIISEHYRIMDGNWTRNGIQTPGVKDNGTWTEREFADFLSQISYDCTSYKVDTGGIK